MKEPSPKELYCFSRAAELQESHHHGSWSKCYRKAEEEYNDLCNLTTPPEYDDDIEDLGGFCDE